MRAGDLSRSRRASFSPHLTVQTNPSVCMMVNDQGTQPELRPFRIGLRKR
jgi:hypothetical protein